jgi:hypothetical protein
VATVFDPVLTLFIDLCYHHFGCGSVNSICSTNYTASSCHCYNGDFIKLWYRAAKTEGTGLTGAFITIMIYLATGVLSCLILHEYLLHVHRDGRILDLWRRVNAPVEEFFIPDDYEISSAELLKIINQAKQYKELLPGNVIKRSVVIHEGMEKDPNDVNYLGKYQRIIIYQNESNGKQFIYRHFLMDSHGKITEVFNDVAKADLVPKRAFGDLFKNKETDHNEAQKDNSSVKNNTSKKGEGEDESSPEAPLNTNRSNNNNNNSRRSSLRPEDEEKGDLPLSSRGTPNNNDKKGVPLLPLQQSASSTGSPLGASPRFILPPPMSGRSMSSRQSLASSVNPLHLTVKELSKRSLNNNNNNNNGGDEPEEQLDNDMDYDLVPKEEDYQHQEELLQQRRKKLHLDAEDAEEEERYNDEYYNQDHDMDEELERHEQHQRRQSQQQNNNSNNNNRGPSPKKVARRFKGKIGKAPSDNEPSSEAK